MMKIIQSIPDILQLLRKVSYQGISRFEFTANLSARFQDQKVFSFLTLISQSFTGLSVKSALIYLSKAFGEGLKQNFLGPNINTEFAALTVRVYSMAIVKLIAHNPILNSIKFLIK
jgi:hypothetical protein